MIRQTSINSLLSIRDQLGHMQQIVYWGVVNHPYCTDRELAVFLGVSDPNVVRPRRKELLDQDLIVDCGVRECTISGKQSHTWAINTGVLYG